jgi:bifunctional non-homologous end joining protein LigD
VRGELLRWPPRRQPGFIKPQLATLKAKAPSGDQWLHEIKFEGYRVQVHLDKGRKQMFTRNGLDWTKRFSLIAGARDVPGQVILDGEVVVKLIMSVNGFAALMICTNPLQDT